MQERFLPYFAERGFSCHAISLRAQAGSDKPPGAKSGGSLTQHADDISHFIRSNLQQAPILVGHSFGGLLTQTCVCPSCTKLLHTKHDHDTDCA